MKRVRGRALLSISVVLVLASAAAAQSTPAAPADDANEVEAVVVTARRSGLPVWRVGDENSAIVFVGAITSLPKDVTWRQAELEEAVAGSRKVLHSVELNVTAGDLYRVLLKRGRWTDLPSGERLSAKLDPELARRLAGYAAAGKLSRNYDRLRPWYAARRLRRAARSGGGGGVTALDVATKAAKRYKRPVVSVLPLFFNDVMARAPEERPTDIDCLRAVADAADAGPGALMARARSWTRGRVSEVIASPWTRSESLCWPEGDSGAGAPLRTAWRTAAKSELARPGAVVAVVPLLYLAEPGGLLDDLQAEGYAIEGPRWRSGPS